MFLFEEELCKEEVELHVELEERQLRDQHECLLEVAPLAGEVLDLHETGVAVEDLLRPLQTEEEALFVRLRAVRVWKRLHHYHSLFRERKETQGVDRLHYLAVVDVEVHCANAV